MGTTTVSKSIDNSTISDLTDDAIDQLMRGAPESYSEPGEDVDPIDPEVVASPAIDFTGDTVMLTNIRHSSEEVFIPDMGSNRWSGRKVMFVDHRLVTDPDTAAIVKSACPYVYEENLSLPVSDWQIHPETNFRTTNPRAFSEYARQYAENR